ncbi:MAG TPA: helix-turn-helix transcriptional regulator [Allosphingosinicella sp.]|nr:helix-turn-helix transcriptional regulator [Allosphingosinicella sp.]
MLSEEDRARLRRFGARVRALRKARGLSQEALALNCDLDRSYVGGIERGERNIGLINVHRLAEALEVKPAEFFKD